MSRMTLSLLAFLFVLPTAGYAYDDHGARDPFWPLISSSGVMISYGQDMSVSDMILEGILSSGEGTYTAIVNGSIVEVGDMVGAYKIQQIEAKKVILSKENETFELDLKKGGE